MVMAIISVVAAVVLPRLDPFVPSRRLKSAARTLSGAITLAYGESAAKNKPYRLYLDPSEDMYWIVEVKELEEGEGSGGAIGITLGTSFELLRYSETKTDDEETTPSEPLFTPQKLPPGVHIASVEISEQSALASKGRQYIEFSPLGVASPATISLVNDDGEALTLRYDGITGVPSLVSASETS
jgi:type II secretory pathway pseudopilin PulG